VIVACVANQAVGNDLLEVATWQEMEEHLVSADFAAADESLTGRTLLGTEPDKGKEAV